MYFSQEMKEKSQIQEEFVQQLQKFCEDLDKAHDEKGELSNQTLTYFRVG